MYKIRADFVRHQDVSLSDVYDEVGVYVLWNRHGQIVPTYVG